MNQNVFIVIQYNGSRYAGWQYQPDRITIQGEIERALKKLTGRNIRITGAGRTDAGVHALGQTANFVIDHRLPVEKYADGLNFYLPDDILIVSAKSAAIGFDARFDAVYRRYRYEIGRGRSALAFDRRWQPGFAMQKEKLQKAAAFVTGEHDFRTFCVQSSQKANNDCIVYRSEWSFESDVWRYEIVANRFLHTMIRSLVGHLTEYAAGRITWNDFRDVFRSGDHTRLAKVAPAKGLTLVEIGY
jgi:tRNA pseudouridine38-40 synthase